MNVSQNLYIEVLDKLKSEIVKARQRAALAVNSELLQLYWNIGKTILQQQDKEGWGTKIIENLSADLRKSFPDMRGLSSRNLFYMRKFVVVYAERELMQRSVAELPWGHHIILLDKVKDETEREFYIKKCIENGWSRDILSLQIKSGLYNRQGKNISNFINSLTSPQSDLARETLKDPYIFDFLSLSEDYQEKDLEKALTDHITKFLLELGSGFAFVGRQFHLEIGGQDFYIDLLFYHIKLRCYIVIELKKGKFIPEFAGKLNFYLSVVDDKLKGEYDNPTIGLLICQDKNKVVAEYALKDVSKPIGISEYQLVESIPENLKGKLPTIEDLERELEGPSL